MNARTRARRRKTQKERLALYEQGYAVVANQRQPNGKVVDGELIARAEADGTLVYVCRNGLR